MIPHEKRLPVSLLSLRIGVFIVMFFWSLDKIVNPDHAAAVFATFYFMEGMSAGALAIIGAVQLVIVFAFLAGLFRTWTYGLVLLMHLVSTLASFPGYLEPWDNLLFFAAWPMLAACITLFLLREQDTMFAVDAMRGRGRPEPVGSGTA